MTSIPVTITPIYLPASPKSPEDPGGMRNYHLLASLGEQFALPFCPSYPLEVPPSLSLSGRVCMHMPTQQGAAWMNNLSSALSCGGT